MTDEGKPVCILAWEVARDLEDCPRCEAPAGHACVEAVTRGADGRVTNEREMYGQVHDERLVAEQARNSEVRT